jgi:hypothetical protein
MANEITKVYIQSHEIPASPGPPQNCNRIICETHALPFATADIPRPITEVNSSVPQYHILATWASETPRMGFSKHRRMTAKHRREGIEPNVFSDFAGINLTSQEGMRLQIKTKLRFFGISQDGTPNGKDNLEAATANARHTALTSGLTPVHCALFGDDPTPGDYIELVMCDSGQEFITEPGQRLPICRVVTMQQMQDLLAPGGGGHGGGYGGHGHGGGHGGGYGEPTFGDHIAVSHVMQTLAKQPALSKDWKIELMGAMAVWKQRTLGVPVYIPEIIRKESIKWKLKVLKYSDAEQDEFLAALGMFGIEENNTELKINPSALTTGAIINPFATLNMSIEADSVNKSALTACLYGSKTAPPITDHIDRVLNKDDDGRTWDIPSTKDIFLRYVVRYGEGATPATDNYKALVTAVNAMKYKETNEAIAAIKADVRDAATEAIRKVNETPFDGIGDNVNVIINTAIANAIEVKGDTIVVGYNQLDAVYIVEQKLTFPGVATSSPEVGAYVAQIAERLKTDDKFGGSFSVGASGDDLRRVYGDYAEIAISVRQIGSGSTIYTTASKEGERIFGIEVWKRFSNEEKKQMEDEVFVKYDGFDATYVMGLLGKTRNPMFFEHPAVRWALFPKAMTSADRKTGRMFKMDGGSGTQRIEFSTVELFGTQFLDDTEITGRILATTDIYADKAEFRFSDTYGGIERYNMSDRSGSIVTGAHLDGSDHLHPHVAASLGARITTGSHHTVGGSRHHRGGDGYEFKQANSKLEINEELKRVPILLVNIMGKYQGGWTGKDGEQKIELQIGAPLGTL